MNTNLPLISNATWTSSIIDLTNPIYNNLKFINMIVRCNVACTAYIYQSIDSNTWTILGNQSVLANVSTFLNCKPTARYIRVSVLNGASNMGFLNVLTQISKYDEISEVCLIDSSGNSITTNNSLNTNEVDIFGNRAQNSNIGERRVTEINKLVGEPFDASLLDSNFWSAYTANNGTTTVFDCEAWLISGSGTANSQAIISTINKARHIGQYVNVFRASLFLGDTGYQNCIRRWGCSDVLPNNTIRNGCYFQFSGSTLSVVTVNNTSISSQILGNITMNIPHIYEIHYSTNYFNFIIDGVSVFNSNTYYPRWSQALHLYGFLSNTCSDNSNGGYALVCRSLTISRMGPLHCQNESYFRNGSTTTGTILKSSCGLLNSLTICNISNNSNISLFDGLDATGVLLFSTGAMSTQTIPINIHFSHGIPFNIGLCLVIGTASSNVLVEYE